MSHYRIVWKNVMALVREQLIEVDDIVFSKMFSVFGMVLQCRVGFGEGVKCVQGWVLFERNVIGS